MTGARSIFDDETLAEISRHLRDPHPIGIPSATDRAFWEGIADHAVVTALLAQARQLHGTPWPHVPARGYLRYARDGNRIIHEQHIRARQERLTLATIAAAVTDAPEWYDEVADGVLLLCEQTSWCWPAHDEAYGRGFALPDVTDPTLDLGAGEVAGQLAWVGHVLGARLDDVAPGLRPRLRHEVHSRVIRPFLEREWHWLGTSGDINNWNPWIHQNVLTAALLLIDDPDLRESVVRRSLWGLEIYLRALPADGAIDEGFDYWWNGACRTLECLSLIERASGGAFSAQRVPALRATLEFPISTWLGGGWCYSFSDSHPPINRELPWHLLHRWAREAEAVDTANFALTQRQEPAATITEGLARLLFALTDSDWMHAPVPEAPAPPSVYLDSTQVFVAHRGEFSLAAKGGHNEENHNHLDVGSVVAAWRGTPVLVDPGRETYTAQTFSDARYELWYTRSEWHNLPEPAGRGQPPGRKFQARILRAEPAADPAEFALDLTAAYDAPGHWERSAALTADGIDVRDAWEGFDPGAARHEITWVIAGEVTETGPAQLTIRPLAAPGGPPAEDALILEWDPALADPALEQRELTDDYQRTAWGEHLTRVRLLISREHVGAGEIVTTLRRHH